MGYDRGDRFPFDFEPNGNPFGSPSKGKCHHDHIPLNLKGNGILVFSVQVEREDGVSRHHGVKIEGPSQLLQKINATLYSRFRGHSVRPGYH